MPHALPRELAEFLYFQHFEVTFLLQELARFYFAQADALLQEKSQTVFQPLQVCCCIFYLYIFMVFFVLFIMKLFFYLIDTDNLWLKRLSTY